MKIDMRKWVHDCINAPMKKAMPILSFPGIQLTGHTVDEVVRNGHLQAVCMEAIARKFHTAAAFSLMDLSVEAEAFGSRIHYSGDEVPTVTAALIHNEEEAEILQVPDVGAGRTGECVSGIREVSSLITDRPVLAGIIGPYSLAGRLLDMTEIMILCYEEPELVETVLEKATEFLIKYALSQFVSLPDRRLDTLSGKALLLGYINERVQTSDWEGSHTVGEFLYGSNWPETSMLLTYVEIPGVYVDLDRDVVVCSDHIEAKVTEKRQQEVVLALKNPTPYDARVTVLAEHERGGKKLGHLYFERMEKVLVPAGKEKIAVVKVWE